MAHKPRVTNQFVSIADTAEFIGVDTRTVRNMISDGRLRAYRLAGGRTFRIRRSDLEALLVPFEASADIADAVAAWAAE
jgi:excisionase family DNA binding protein